MEGTGLLEARDFTITSEDEGWNTNGGLEMEMYNAPRGEAQLPPPLPTREERSIGVPWPRPPATTTLGLAHSASLETRGGRGECEGVPQGGPGSRHPLREESSVRAPWLCPPPL